MKEGDMTRLKDGTKMHLYLLDEQLGMEKIDLISTNLTEKMPIRIWNFRAGNLWRYEVLQQSSP